jgi:hypothetical protein
MPNISSISVKIQTGSMDDAGTDGDIYLGVCGREFYVDSQSDDFERGSSAEYIFGDGANVSNPQANDPRVQGLHTDNVRRFPVYIRFQPTSRTDHWNMALADLTFNGESFPRWITNNYINPKTGIWLGTRSGMYVHFLNLQEPV